MDGNSVFAAGHDPVVASLTWDLGMRDAGRAVGSEHMQCDVSTQNGATIVRPAGERLDIEVAAQFRAMLLSLIEQGNRQLVVDLSDVNFIDSSGLGALVSALKTLKRSAGTGDVRLARVQPPVISLLEIIRLNRVFTTYNSVEDAVQSYAGA